MTTETYTAALDPVKGTLLKKDRQTRRDKGHRRRGWKIKHIKKIFQLLKEIFTEKP